MLKKTAFSGVILLLIIGLCIPFITAFGQNHMISDPSYDPSFVINQNHAAHSRQGAKLNDPAENGVNPMYEIPTVTKKIRISSAGSAAPWESGLYCGMGETISFMTVGSVPENIGEYRNCFYSFAEELPAGICYEKDTVKVTLNDENGEDITQYFDITQDNHTLVVICHDLISAGVTSEQEQLVLSYRAKLSSDAVMGNPGNLCKSVLECSVDSLQEGATDPVTECSAEAVAVVFTFGLNVSKVDMGTQLPVAYVEFILRDEAGRYLVTAENTMADRWGLERREASPLRTDDEGTFSLFGLAPGTYFLEETKTADGYHILDEPVKLQLVALRNDTQDQVGKVDKLSVIIDEGDPVYSSSSNCDMVDIKIENTYGPELPPTGGAGTSIYYVLGALVVFVAALVYVAKQRGKNTAAS